MDIMTMTDRQIIAGLMRGNAAEFQQGYSAEAAVLSLNRLRPATCDRRNELLAYAEGFADGLLEDIAQLSPAHRVSDATVKAGQ